MDATLLAHFITNGCKRYPHATLMKKKTTTVPFTRPTTP